MEGSGFESQTWARSAAAVEGACASGSEAVEFEGSMGTRLGVRTYGLHGSHTGASHQRLPRFREWSQPCRDRVTADRLAAKIAASNGIAVTNLLVAASSSTARTFVTELNPHADNLLIDDGTVGVEQYAGADDGCWIVVEDQRVIWQGPADLNQIAVHLVR